MGRLDEHSDKGTTASMTYMEADDVIVVPACGSRVAACAAIIVSKMGETFSV